MEVEVIKSSPDDVVLKYKGEAEEFKQTVLKLNSLKFNDITHKNMILDAKSDSKMAITMTANSPLTVIKVEFV